MFQLLTIVTTITGIFTLLDLFIEKNAKAKVAEFVFGFGTANFAGFESNAIKALLSLVKVDDRISFKRILFRYSGMIALFLTLFSVFGMLFSKHEFFEPTFDSNFLTVLETLLGIPLAALMFWPFDIWSLKVTDKIFGSSESASVLRFFGRVIADIFITLLPLVALSVVLFLTYGASVNPEEAFEISVLNVAMLVGAIFTTVNIFGSLLVTIIQLLTLAVGVLLRTILRLAKLNQHIAMISRAHEFPFTFIGLVFGIVTGVSVIAFT